MKIEDFEKCNIKKLKEDILQVKETVFEVTSLIMEMNYMDKCDIDVIKLLRDKCQKILTVTCENLKEASASKEIIYNGKLEKYFEQLNIYINSLNVLIFILNIYDNNYHMHYKNENIVEEIMAINSLISEKSNNYCTMFGERITYLGNKYYE